MHAPQVALTGECRSILFGSITRKLLQIEWLRHALSCVGGRSPLSCFGLIALESGMECAVEARNARIGLVLFFVYLLLYGGFVFINAYSPTTMESTPFAGVNLAILYGFGLIIAAFLMALLYGFLCRERGDEKQSEEGQP